MDETQEAFAPRHPWARYLTVLAVVALIASAFAIVVSNAARASTPTPTPTPSAVGPRHEMYIGTVALTIQTTNPLEYTLVDEFILDASVYSYLVNYGPNWQLEPDLATTWAQTNTNPSTWEFHLAHNAYFVDPRDCSLDVNGHPQCPSNGPYPPVNVKASDVKFTYDYVKKNRNATSYFASASEHIASVDLSPTDPYYVRVTFDEAYAPAMNGTFTVIPILPQYIWSPGGSDVKVTWSNALPIGSGPFMVRPVGTTFAMVTPPPLILDRNPVWHGTEVQGRQVFADTLYYESYTTSGAMALDLTLGKIDLAMGPNAQDYTTFLNGKPGIIRQSVSDGFEAEQAINVLPDYLRSYFNSISTRPLNLGHTNPLLLNQAVRTAIHMVTNRSEMINNALGGYATPGDSLIPLSSPNHYSVPPYNPATPNEYPPYINTYPPSALEQFPDDTGNANPSLNSAHMARQVLHDAGWLYICATGAPDDGISYPLCQQDSSGKMINSLTFRYSTFNTEPWWETAARGVIADAAKAGIQFNLELLNSAQMYNLWYRLDYDVWLWDWVWSPPTDISTFMIVQTCHGIITLDNDNGFCLIDPSTGRWTMDDLYNETLTTTDPVARKAISDEMSNIIYSYASYNLPFYRAELYAMNQVRWTNWGDFNAHNGVPPDIGNSPILGQVVYPVDQKPPQFTLSNFEGVAGQPVQFSVAAVDPQGGTLNYRWDFDTSVDTNGDGIPWNDDQGGNTPTPTWTYNTPGTYGIELRVSEAGGGFFTVQKAQVTIRAAGTGAPKVSAIAFGPADPTTYPGDVVTLAASASDPAGLALTQYSWDWGDGSAVTITTGPTASHQYTTVGTYTAQLTVKNSAGVTGSSSTIIPVTANVPPIVAPLQAESVVVSTNNSFVAFASDANLRDVLTYSWNFGDGSPVVSGNPVYHIYTTQNVQYTQTVTVSDGHGHTVSSSAAINVVASKNTAPSINSLTANPATTWTTLPTQLTANVSDPQGYPLLWQWNFDGIHGDNYTTPLTAPGEFVIRTETWLFPTAGTYKPKLTITNQPPTGTGKSTFTTVTVTVKLNHPPTLTAITLSPSVGIAGQTFSFAATSNDVDGDKLTYTWDFGDGTTLTGTTGYFGGALSATHAYGADGSYVTVLDVNDGKGGDARQSVIVNVAAAGLLRVTTNPAVAGKIFVDGSPADEWGLAWMKTTPGTHTVSFGDVYGFGTPSPQTVTVTAGTTTSVEGDYVQYGSLRIMTNPALPATISVNGQPADDYGVWRAAAPGSYTVHFGLVAGYDPPPDQVANVVAGALVTITGNYVADSSAPGPDPSTFGYLRVTTNPAVAAQILVDGIPRDEWGLAWVKMAPGTYTVSFTSVYGVTPPAPQAVTVTAGATATYNAAFTVLGSLRILTSPALPGTIFVNGIPRDDWGMWQSMAPGTYTVSFGPVPGYATPAPQTATVTAGVLTPITGAYVAIATTTTPLTGSSSATPAAASAPALASGSRSVGAPVSASTDVTTSSAVDIPMAVPRDES